MTNHGDNLSGADNQQGRPTRPLTPEYIAGFVDGEGCFSVSIRPHPTVRYGTGWLIGPCFQVYQHRANVGILESIRGYFGCGRIAAKGPNSSVITYSVYRRNDLESVIVPFFDTYPLLSAKQEDFLKFRDVVVSMSRKEHRTEAGFRRVVEVAYSMNQRGKQRRYELAEILAEPSETARRVPAQLELVKIQSEPHGDMGRTAEMTVPPSRKQLDGSNKTA